MGMLAIGLIGCRSAEDDATQPAGSDVTQPVKDDATQPENEGGNDGTAAAGNIDDDGTATGEGEAIVTGDAGTTADDAATALPTSAPARTSAGGEWSGMTAAEIVERMGVGISIGNTFDATGGNKTNIYSQEKSWGNPIVTAEQIHTVAAGGFKTLRIPITWMNHIDTADGYHIDEAWLARIREIVDYAYDEGLVVIINLHHEDWINKADLDTEYASTGVELGAVWKQIAAYFADYDQHLIFEVMNEPRMAGTDLEWSGNAAAYDAINYLNDIAVNAIRSSYAGYNQERAIMIPGYAASSSVSTMNRVEIPLVNGEQATNIIASVHGYTPYSFCLSDAQVDFDLNNTSDTSQIDSLFEGIYRVFISKGIPVVLGETGATNTKGNTEARENWAYYMAKAGAEYGVPTILWDNGATGMSGGECHAYLDRKEGNGWYYPTVIAQFVKGAEDAQWGSKSAAAVSIGTEGGVFWSEESGRTSTAEWNADYIRITSYPDFYITGGSVEVTYTGSGQPKLMVDSSVHAQWWMPVDPDSIEERDGMKVAVFKVSSILKVTSGYGVTDLEDLRDICVLATNGSITTYTITAVAQ